MTPTTHTYGREDPKSSERFLPTCNRQLSAPAGRGWHTEICERNSSYSIGSVESPSASCEGGEAHCPETGLAGSGARNFANAGRGYSTPVSGTRLVRGCFWIQGKSTFRSVRVCSRFPSIWLQRWRRRLAFRCEPMVLVSSSPSHSPTPARNPISHPVREVPARKRAALA